MNDPESNAETEPQVQGGLDVEVTVSVGDPSPATVPPTEEEEKDLERAPETSQPTEDDELGTPSPEGETDNEQSPDEQPTCSSGEHTDCAPTRYEKLLDIRPSWRALTEEDQASSAGASGSPLSAGGAGSPSTPLGRHPPVTTPYDGDISDYSEGALQGCTLSPDAPPSGTRLPLPPLAQGSPLSPKRKTKPAGSPRAKRGKPKSEEILNETTMKCLRTGCFQKGEGLHLIKPQYSSTDDQTPSPTESELEAGRNNEAAAYPKSEDQPAEFRKSRDRIRTSQHLWGRTPRQRAQWRLGRERHESGEYTGSLQQSEGSPEEHEDPVAGDDIQEQAGRHQKQIQQKPGETHGTLQIAEEQEEGTTESEQGTSSVESSEDSTESSENIPEYRIHDVPEYEIHEEPEARGGAIQQQELMQTATEALPHPAQPQLPQAEDTFTGHG